MTKPVIDIDDFTSFYDYSVDIQALSDRLAQLAREGVVSRQDWYSLDRDIAEEIKLGLSPKDLYYSVKHAISGIIPVEEKDHLLIFTVSEMGDIVVMSGTKDAVETEMVYCSGVVPEKEKFIEIGSGQYISTHHIISIRMEPVK